MAEVKPADQKDSKPKDGDSSKPQDDAALKPQDGGIMASALYNLMIAQQYIDATNQLPEHRLVCFHYAVALLAAGRNNPAQRAMARQYFETVLGWEASKLDPPKIRESIDRVVCESHYNLGVIDELETNYEAAQKSYKNATKLAEDRDGRFDNIAVLAELGSISSNTALIKAQSETIKIGKDISPADMKLHAQLVKAVGKEKREINKLKEKIKMLRELAPKPWQAPLSTAQAKPESVGTAVGLSEAAPEEVPPPQGDAEEAPRSSAKPHGVLRRPEILSQIEDKLDTFKTELNKLEVPKA
jgi:hypothetical protein